MLDICLTDREITLRTLLPYILFSVIIIIFYINNCYKYVDDLFWWGKKSALVKIVSNYSIVLFDALVNIAQFCTLAAD